jgi:predicted ATPase
MAIELTAKGGLSTWPTGFFDQSEKDLAAILEARRHAR